MKETRKLELTKIENAKEIAVIELSLLSNIFVSRKAYKRGERVNTKQISDPFATFACQTADNDCLHYFYLSGIVDSQTGTLPGTKKLGERL